MRVLLDTCIVAELQKPKPHPAVLEAVSRADDEDLFLSVLTIGEITRGIAQLAAGKKKRQLAAWLRGLEEDFSDRLLAVDHETATIWGEITARARRQGTTVPAVEGLLAATALRHGLNLMTRNARHVAVAGVLVVNPWETD